MSEQAELVPVPRAAPSRRRPPRRPAPAPVLVITVTVTWKSGKQELHQAAGVHYVPGQVVLQTITPDGWVRTVFLSRDEMRKLEVEEPWRPPAQALPEPAYRERAPLPAAPPAESVMHVSPGMAHRKGQGQTLVTPDGQTATRTPEGDILGAALFAAGVPAGRVGL